MPLGMIGKYERLDVLGHGVSGIVYLAKDTLLNKQIALKEVDVQAGDLSRFLEEARVMDRLRHPNIVRVNNVDRIEGKVVIDMEYVRGQNLQELLRQEGALSVERGLDIAAQVLDALDYAHQMQTVHRDIKPANILIGRDGQVKLVDFGLAEILATNAYAGGAGTYAYMAPEDFAEDDRSDHQSDIWAVGVTFFEMVSGQRPFNVVKVKDPFAWKRVLETEASTPLAAYLPDAPPLLQSILDRALARDKRRRYQTAGEFRDDLLHLKAGQAVSSTTLRQSQPRRGLLPRRVGVAPAAPAGTPTMDILDTLPVTSNGVGAVPDYRAKEKGESNPTPDYLNARTPDLPLTSAGRVVADVNPPPVHTQVSANAGAWRDKQENRSEREAVAKTRRPFARRNAEQRLIVEPGRVDFGAVHKGELPSVKITARVTNAEGDVEGRVLPMADWLTVHPPAFERGKQSLTITAHSARVWETGEFHETLRIETSAGTAEVPVRLVVLKPRPSFLQVAAWFTPLFAAALLPALAIAFGKHGAQFHARYIPGAATASGLLALMLLLVSIAADIGMAERIASGVLMAVMCAVLGISAANVTDRAVHADGVERAVMIGGFLGGVVLLQLLHLRKWKLWAFIILALGLLIGGALLKMLS